MPVVWTWNVVVDRPGGTQYKLNVTSRAASLRQLGQGFPSFPTENSLRIFKARSPIMLSLIVLAVRGLAHPGDSRREEMSLTVSWFALLCWDILSSLLSMWLVSIAEQKIVVGAFKKGNLLSTLRRL